MSKHNAQGSDTEEIDYADEFVIDEGGIDLKWDGKSVLSVSFDHVDNYQIAYEVLPETYTLSPDADPEQFEEALQILAERENVTDLDLEGSARLFLTALARRKGYEKK